MIISLLLLLDGNARHGQTLLWGGMTFSYIIHIKWGFRRIQTADSSDFSPKNGFTILLHLVLGIAPFFLFLSALATIATTSSTTVFKTIHHRVIIMFGAAIFVGIVFYLREKRAAMD